MKKFFVFVAFSILGTVAFSACPTGGGPPTVQKTVCDSLNGRGLGGDSNAVFKHLKVLGGDTSARVSGWLFIGTGPDSAATKAYARSIISSGACGGNCDSTGQGRLVRELSPTLSGVVTNFGRDSTVGRIAAHGSIKSDSIVTGLQVRVSDVSFPGAFVLKSSAGGLIQAQTQIIGSQNNVVTAGAISGSSDTICMTDCARLSASGNLTNYSVRGRFASMHLAGADTVKGLLDSGSAIITQNISVGANATIQGDINGGTLNTISGKFVALGDGSVEAATGAVTIDASGNLSALSLHSAGTISSADYGSTPALRTISGVIAPAKYAGTTDTIAMTDYVRSVAISGPCSGAISCDSTGTGPIVRKFTPTIYSLTTQALLTGDSATFSGNTYGKLFYFGNVNANQAVFNSAGDYATIANPSINLWALGHSNALTTLGTSSLTWDNTGKVAVLGTFSVTGRTGFGLTNPAAMTFGPDFVELNRDTATFLSLISNGSTSISTLGLFKRNGTNASPTPATSGQVIARIATGSDTVAGGPIIQANPISFVADGNWAFGSMGYENRFTIIDSGSSSGHVLLDLKRRWVGINTTTRDATKALTVAGNARIDTNLSVGKSIRTGAIDTFDLSANFPSLTASVNTCLDGSKNLTTSGCANGTITGTISSNSIPHASSSGVLSNSNISYNSGSGTIQLWADGHAVFGPAFSSSVHTDSGVVAGGSVQAVGSFTSSTGGVDVAEDIVSGTLTSSETRLVAALPNGTLILAPDSLRAKVDTATLSISGCSSPVSVLATYSVSGRNIIWSIPNMSCTSSSTSDLNIDGIPIALLPLSTTPFIPIGAVSQNGINFSGGINIDDNGDGGHIEVSALYTDVGGQHPVAFSTSEEKGIPNGLMFSYIMVAP